MSVAAHMNSIHLDAETRREAFRRAREKLVNACGEHTLHFNDRQIQYELADLNKHIFNDPHGPTCDPTPKLAKAPILILNKGDRRIPLKVGANTLGRLPDNDIVVSDPCISRRHCSVLMHANFRCELHDMASKNGTYVNGVKIDGPLRLQVGDEIQIGDLRFLLVEPEPSRAGQSQPPPSGNTSLLLAS